jgi:hypothetical protein
LRKRKKCNQLEKTEVAVRFGYVRCHAWFHVFGRFVSDEESERVRRQVDAVIPRIATAKTERCGFGKYTKPKHKRQETQLFPEEFRESIAQREKCPAGNPDRMKY